MFLHYNKEAALHLLCALKKEQKSSIIVLLPFASCALALLPNEYLAGIPAGAKTHSCHWDMTQLNTQIDSESLSPHLEQR